MTTGNLREHICNTLKRDSGIFEEVGLQDYIGDFIYKIKIFVEGLLIKNITINEKNK